MKMNGGSEMVPVRNLAYPFESSLRALYRSQGPSEGSDEPRVGFLADRSFWMSVCEPGAGLEEWVYRYEHGPSEGWLSSALYDYCNGVAWSLDDMGGLDASLPAVLSRIERRRDARRKPRLVSS